MEATLLVSAIKRLCSTALSLLKHEDVTQQNLQPLKEVDNAGEKKDNVSDPCLRQVTTSVRNQVNVEYIPDQSPMHEIIKLVANDPTPFPSLLKLEQLPWLLYPQPLQMDHTPIETSSPQPVHTHTKKKEELENFQLCLSYHLISFGNHTKTSRKCSIPRPRSLLCRKFCQVRFLLRDCLEAYVVKLTLKYLSVFGKRGRSNAKLWAAASRTTVAGSSISCCTIDKIRESRISGRTNSASSPHDWATSKRRSSYMWLIYISQYNTKSSCKSWWKIW